MISEDLVRRADGALRNSSPKTPDSELLENNASFK